MKPPQGPTIHEFGDFELDAQRHVLTSRLDGQPVDITGRVMEALVYLVERPGQLVEKKALMDALWPHVVVEEGNLTQTIHTLRRVLGERAGEHRYIATVPGRGYRFVADVKVRDGHVPAPAQASPPVTVAPPQSRRWWLPGVASLLVVLAVAVALIWRDHRRAPSESAAPASVAVLPFVDMSEAGDQAHFADGLSEEILNLLARADSLRVIARTSSFSFRDQAVDIGTIARRLNVTHVLEGSVRKAGTRVRVTAQLIDGETSAHVWSDTFDRELTDIFGVQREIAAAVAAALHVTLRTDGPRPSETASPEAYDHYLQARHLIHRRSGTDIEQAKEHFEKAVQIDPSYGRAWAGLAGVYLVARYSDVKFPDEMPKWREAAERAVALLPDSAEAQFRAAQFQWHAGDIDAALRHMERARALDPQDPLVMGSTLSRIVYDGRLDEAIEMQRKIVAKDPLSATNRGTLGSLLLLDGRLEEARAESERSLELSPASPYMMENVADVLILQGEGAGALEVISRLPSGYRRDQRLALVYFAQKSAEDAESAFARLQEAAGKAGAGADEALALAEVHAQKGEPGPAFRWLTEAERRSRLPGAATPDWMLFEHLVVSAFLKPLHGDPRWSALLASLHESPAFRRDVLDSRDE